MIRFMSSQTSLNPIALRQAKIVYNFGLSECNRVTRLPKGKTNIGCLRQVAP